MIGTGEAVVPRDIGIHLWTMITRPSHAGVIDNFLPLLAPEERRRAERFRDEADRADFIAAHVLLRHALAASGLPFPDNKELEIANFGRPVLPASSGGKQVRMSLAHAPGLAACAISPGGCPVGVDVESFGAAPVLRKTGNTWMSGAERAAAAGRSGRSLDAYLLRLWTLKEAFAKATGLGLSLRFNQIAFALDPVSLRLPQTSGARCWRFAEARPTPDHALSLAVCLPRRQTRFRVLAHEVTADCRGSINLRDLPSPVESDLLRRQALLG
jgi:4'-phosphopantetheinyl transferase